MYERSTSRPASTCSTGPGARATSASTSFRWDEQRLPQLPRACSPHSAAAATARALERRVRRRRRIRRQRRRGARTAISRRARRARHARRAVLDLTNPEARAWWKRRSTSRSCALGHLGDQARPRRGAHPLGAEPTSSPTAATARGAQRLSRRYSRSSTTTLLATARGDGDFVRHRALGLRRRASTGASSGAATRRAARPSAPVPAPTSACAARSSASSAPPSSASRSGARTPAATTSSRSRDVFARWLEFSAFCALMEIGGHGAHAPWDMPTEPHYDQEMIDIYRATCACITT